MTNEKTQAAEIHLNKLIKDMGIDQFWNPRDRLLSLIIGGSRITVPLGIEIMTPFDIITQIALRSFYIGIRQGKRDVGIFLSGLIEEAK